MKNGLRLLERGKCHSVEGANSKIPRRLPPSHVLRCRMFVNKVRMFCFCVGVHGGRRILLHSMLITHVRCVSCMSRLPASSTTYAVWYLFIKVSWLSRYKCVGEGRWRHTHVHQPQPSGLLSELVCVHEEKDLAPEWRLVISQSWQGSKRMRKRAPDGDRDGSLPTGPGPKRPCPLVSSTVGPTGSAHSSTGHVQSPGGRPTAAATPLTTTSQPSASQTARPAALGSPSSSSWVSFPPTATTSSWTSSHGNNPRRNNPTQLSSQPTPAVPQPHSQPQPKLHPEPPPDSQHISHPICFSRWFQNLERFMVNMQIRARKEAFLYADTGEISSQEGQKPLI